MKISYFFKPLAITIMMLLAVTYVNGARTASVSGNWSNTATWGGSSVPTSADAVTINSGITVTVDVAGAQCSSVTFAAVNASSALTINGTNSLTISGAVSMPRPAASFTCTINVNAGSVSIGTTLNMAASSISSGTRTDIINVTSGTLAVSGNTNLSGTTGNIFNITSTGVFNFGGTLSNVPTLTVAAGSTVIYGGSSEAVSVTTYSNLTLSGSGVKTFASAPAVNGVLSMEGTATISVAPTYGGTATLQYNTSTSRTAGVEWISSFTATGGVKIAGSGIITTGASKTLISGVPLVINTGASLTTGSASSWALTVGGTTLVSGTLTLANTRTKTFTGDVTLNSGGVWNETSAASISFGGSLYNNGGTFNANTGTHTFSGGGKILGGTSAISIPSSTFTGTYTNSTTFTVATLLTVTGVTLTNNGTITASTALSGSGGLTQGTTGILNIAAASAITTLTASAAGNIVNYTGGAQTVKATTYNNLTLLGTLAKTFPSGTTTVYGILSREGTATTTVTGTLAYGASAILQYKGSAAQTAGGEFPATFSAGQLAGIKIENALGVTLNAAKNIGARSLTIGSLVANSIFKDGGFQLTATGTLTLTSGTFKLGAANATAFPAFGTTDFASGSTVEYAATATQTVKGITYSNLTISGTGNNSKKADADITVNGILNLNSSNASSTQGCLEMTNSYGTYPGTTNTDYLNSYILNMGASATTAGTGDVTGTVKRSTILENTPYTFGHQYSTVALTSGTMPGFVSVTTTIGTSPPGKADAIRRTYEIVVSPDGSGSTVTANLHYLDSEFNGNTEANLVTWDYDIGGGVAEPDEHGRSDYDFTNNFVGLSNIPIDYFINIPGHAWRTIFTLADFGENYYTWTGSLSSNWATPGNWTVSAGGSGIPNSLSHVIIPDAAATDYDPVLPAGVTLNSLSFSNGGILTMGSNTLTIANSLSGGWEDQNTNGNDPATSSVIFSMPGTVISGNAWFYNIQIADGADITNQAGSLMKIQNSVSKTGSGTGKWYADVFDATIEYNGAAQTVLLTDGTPNYHNLILSGSGTKTMPSSAMILHGSFTLNGTASATAGAALTIGGNVVISSGTTFNASSYTHNVAGNWTNNGGTFTPGSSTINYNSSLATQTINGTASSQAFNSISVNKTSQALTVGGSTTTLTLNGNLTVTSGTLDAGTANINIAGNWSNSGTFSAGTHTVTFNGSSLQYISGNSAFNNLTINNAAGVMATGDQSVTGILYLQSANPAATQGSLMISNPFAITMGASATTTGAGDVTGIVKRTSFAINTPYSFGNQYTTLNLLAGGTLPSEVSFKTVLTTDHTWKTEAINRYYDIIQTGGDDATKVVLNLHYLDGAELNGAIEGNLDLFDDHVGSVVHDHGRSNFNTTENWVGLANLSLTYVAAGSSFDAKYWTLGTSTTGNLCTWIAAGSDKALWGDPANWSGGVPTPTSHVVIPDAATTDGDPKIPAATTIGTMSIESGGILNSVTGSTFLTISGGAGAWENLGGTFNDGGGSTIVFSSPGATMSGETNFANVTVGDGATLTLSTNTIMRIGVFLSLSSSGILNAATNVTTIEYNGTIQNVAFPNGITAGYRNLILSGTGVKTMPLGPLSIYGNFSLSTEETLSATALEDLAITGALNIGTGTVLTIAAGKALTTLGTTTLNDEECLVLKSDETGTASFIDNGTISGSGTSKIERYLTPYIEQDPTDWRYHFLSSPVENQAIQTEFVALSNTTDDFYAWSEPTGMWINTKLESEPPYTWNSAFETSFIQGKGYLVAYPDAEIKNFIGKPYTSASGITMTCTNTSDGGWNLLGNPFPSAIDWDLVSKGAGMDHALYYYDNEVPVYMYYVRLTGGIAGGSRYIPAMQGFMVHAKVSNLLGPKTITMANTNRVHQSLDLFYKDVAITNNILNISVEGNNMRDEARVCFYEEATMNFDGEFDAYKLFSYNATVPALFSVTPDDTQVAINTLPLSEIYGTVPVGFMPGTSGNFTFFAEGVSSFSPETYIFLEDKKTGILQKLNDNPSYAFTSGTGDNSDRFLLHFNNATSVNNPDKAGDFIVYSEDGFISIRKTGNQSGRAAVTDMSGRIVADLSITASQPTRINLKGHTGVFIVSITTANSVSNTKIFVR